MTKLSPSGGEGDRVLCSASPRQHKISPLCLCCLAITTLVVCVCLSAFHHTRYHSCQLLRPAVSSCEGRDDTAAPRTGTGPFAWLRALFPTTFAEACAILASYDHSSSQFILSRVTKHTTQPERLLRQDPVSRDRSTSKEKRQPPEAQSLAEPHSSSHNVFHAAKARAGLAAPQELVSSRDRGPATSTPPLPPRIRHKTAATIRIRGHAALS